MWVVLPGTRCQLCLLRVLSPQSACVLHLALFVLLICSLTFVRDPLNVCFCPRSDVCGVYSDYTVSVLVPAFSPLSCCTCFLCLSLILHLCIVLHLLLPSSLPTAPLLPSCHLQPDWRGICLCVSWVSHGGAMYPGSPAMLETWSVKPSL